MIAPSFRTNQYPSVKAILAVVILLVLPLMLPMFATDKFIGWDSNWLSGLGNPRLKQPEGLESSAVPTPDIAKNLADAAWGLNYAYQGMRVVGLYRAAEVGGQGIAGFAAPGHWVWEVHVIAGVGISGQGCPVNNLVIVC